VACGKVRRVNGEISVRLDIQSKGARVAIELARRVHAGVKAHAEWTNVFGVVCRIQPPEDDPEPWAAALAQELVVLCHEAANRRSKSTGASQGIRQPHAQDERMSPNYVFDRLRTDHPWICRIDDDPFSITIRTNDAQQSLQGFISTTSRAVRGQCGSVTTITAYMAQIPGVLDRMTR